jgi:hypothetical protein
MGIPLKIVNIILLIINIHHIILYVYDISIIIQPSNHVVFFLYL